MTLSRIARIARQRLRSVARKDEMDAELSRELAFHYDLLVAENAAEGMPAGEARHAARRALGNASLLEEQCRDHRRVGWLHDLRQDLRFGLRVLRKSPGLTAIAAVSLALGIGGNTAILGVAGSVLHNPLPFPDADRLVVIRAVSPANPRQNANATIPEFLAWQGHGRAWEAIGVSLSLVADFAAEGSLPAERVQAQAFSPSLFPVLAVKPLLGRVFGEADSPGAVVVISHRLWQRRFAGDPDIIGRGVRLNGVTATIIGVMPAAFRYPYAQSEAWTPFLLDRSPSDPARLYLVTARLKDGVSLSQAQQDLGRVAARGAWGVRVLALRDAWYGWLAEPLGTLEAAVGFILVIACANVAGLLLARGSARRGELAMRVALGAGRGRIFRQLLTESVLLSVASGLLGALVAWTVLDRLPAITPPPGLPRLAAVGFSLPVFAILAVLSIGAGLVFGLAPALAAFHLDLHRSLKESVPGLGAHPVRRRLRDALIAAQIVLAFVLLIAAGLMNHSFLRLIGRDLHFDPRGLLTFEFRQPWQQYLHGLGSEGGVPSYAIDPPPAATLARVYDRLRFLPGVEAIAGISYIPVNSLYVPSVALAVDGRTDGGTRDATYFLVTPGFFTALKTPLVRGRDFAAGDSASGPWVAIVNESAARRFWPGQNPVGRRFTIDAGPDERPREVIGVVPDIPVRRIDTGPEPVIYTSYLQQPARYRGPAASMFGQMTFLLRTSRNPGNLLPAARQAVAEIDPDRPLGNIQTMEQRLDGRIREQRDYSLLLGLFALTATVLAALGIYGVMAYSVAQRTREIGIRMALGAGRREIVASIGRPVLRQISAGLAFGFSGALLLTRLIAPQLWNVTPTDPVTFAAVSLLFVSVAFLACLFPARRAVRVDPAVTLRTE